MEDPIGTKDVMDAAAAGGNKIIKWKSCPCRSYNNTIVSFKKMNRSTKR